MSFIRLDPQDFVVSADSVVSPAWSGNSISLPGAFTSSIQWNSDSSKFYLDVYDKNPQINSTADIQFSIAYANRTGAGSAPYNNAITGSTPSSTLYGQMRNLLLEDENTYFDFGGVTPDDFYIININRARYKEKILPGTLQLSIENGNNDALVLKDDSPYTLIPTYYGTQRVYNLGLIYGGSHHKYPGDVPTYGSYGLFFPDTGIILLNAKVADLHFNSGGLTMNTQRTYTRCNNHFRLFNKIKNGLSFDPTYLSSEETITSNYIFIRARNSELNYSENPSFISGSTGEVVHDSFIYNPQTYITTIGLYNDNNELLAVSKLSKPLKKDFSSEALIRIRLDF